MSKVSRFNPCWVRITGKQNRLTSIKTSLFAHFMRAKLVRGTNGNNYLRVWCKSYARLEAVQELCKVHLVSYTQE